jgi:GNAT superfamily N-acetyltransferase
MIAPPALSIRPAARDELARAAAIYVANEADASARYHPLLGETFDHHQTTRTALEDLLLLHEEDPRQVWVAEDRAGEVIGFAAAAVRGHHWHLTYLYVSHDWRQQGVGAALLRAIHAAGHEAGCHLFSLQASDDPRALTRYFRLGLVPQPFSVHWGTSQPSFPPPDRISRLQAVPVVADDAAVLNTIDDIDKAVRGVRRRNDLLRWLREGAAGVLLVDRESGTPVGYYLVSVSRESGRIGPVASLDESRFLEVMGTALTSAAGLHAPGVTWSVLSPGENRSAISPLLDASFRPRYCDLFFASGPIGRWESYLFHDVDLL